MVHDPREVGIGKCDATERRRTQHFAGRRFSILAEEKTGLRVQICVSPAVQDDSRDIPPGVKTRSREHVGELLTNLSLIILERRSQHFTPASVSLIGDRQAGIGIQNLQRKHHR